MKKEAVLCGKCIALMGGSFKVVELGPRKKQDCKNCGKRRYGCLCRIERKEPGK